MVENLVIVESPAKAGTIQKFLGEEYVVKPSFGHIRDLQDHKISVDIAHGFTPEYVIPADKKKVVSELRKIAGSVRTVWLASDEDREGEAISWHLMETLGLKAESTRRIVFHEITKTAILHAIDNPRQIDMHLVDAQQARRVLDRLVGFELSPVLWRKIQPKLSAGRVQSVALRLVVDREREILAFRRTPYYHVTAVFHPEGTAEDLRVNATLDTRFPTLEEARKFLEDSKTAEFTVSSAEKKESLRSPAAPFTTSTLQQEASRKLKFPVSLTMRVAQQLYEKGLITYMRTDSTHLSKLALGSAKQFISGHFGGEYARPKQYRTTSKGAQEAHEAIRPTYIDHPDVEGTDQERRLYRLIWKRTVASQMSDAKILKTDLTVVSDRRKENFHVQAAQVLFDGFLKLYMESTDEARQEEEVLLPEIPTGSRMEALSLSGEGRFTAPPARYSEATLVRKLEELGIGRPSTYAPTISTLTTGRGYIAKGDKEGEKIPVTHLLLENGEIREIRRTETVGAEKGRLLPQEIGLLVTDYLVAHFGDILDYDFTANVEKNFDRIADGELAWNELIAAFYAPFHAKIEETLADGQYGKVSRDLGTDPESGLKVVAKFGRFGPYIQKGEGDSRQFAHLDRDQLIESLTLEDALKLFRLPRKVGVHQGVEIIALKGRFGPYLKYGDHNYSLPKNADPLKVSLEECLAAIDRAAVRSGGTLLEFAGGDIKVIDGRYGPYLKYDGGNYRLPKGIDVQALTEARCREIISTTTPTGKRVSRKKQ